ncbi:SpoIIE family protein phosphatase, partial [Catenulispora pinisilvae]|uniref:SpoIIE family protein phosphatase n=1 Tax=Catenulispora pinisilvae TaxID=2705253 RepID=UPI001891CDF9
MAALIPCPRRPAQDQAHAQAEAGSASPFRAAVHRRPGDSAAGLSGDFHAQVRTRVTVRVLIGDARGSGPQAAATAAAVVHAFHTYAADLDLRALAQRLDVTIAHRARLGGTEPELHNAAERHDAAERHEDFATALLIELDLTGPGLRMINRGHPAPLLVTPHSAFPLS